MGRANLDSEVSVDVDVFSVFLCIGRKNKTFCAGSFTSCSTSLSEELDTLPRWVG